MICTVKQPGTGINVRKRRPAAGLMPMLHLAQARVAESKGMAYYITVQLATALDLHKDWSANRLGAFVFISADRALNAAATGEGLTVEDPNSHP